MGDRVVAARLKLTIAYDGSAFSGSQKQANARTVQGELEAVLGRLNGSPVSTVFAGRTDRGVHALGQVVSSEDIRPGMSDERLVRAIDALLPDDVGLVSLERVAGAFHARYDARWREYRYRIGVGGHQPLTRGVCWQRRSHLDVEAMNLGAGRLVGTHDLATFTGGGAGVPWSTRAVAPRGTVRTVLDCSARAFDGLSAWTRGSGTGVEIRIVADGFLPQLVRNLVGALVHVGSSRREPPWITELLAATDRRCAPAPAPPQGLILWTVGYDLGPEAPGTTGSTIRGT